MDRRKSPVQELSDVYKNLFADILVAYPSMRLELERDLNTLMRLVENRGIGVYLLDLPAAGKHFDRCLDNAEYTTSGLPLTKRFSRRVPIPKFLRGLHLLVFDESGRLKERADIQAIFFIRQIYLMCKKFDCDTTLSRKKQAIADFYSTDLEHQEPSGFWSSENLTTEDVRREFSGTKNSPRFIAAVSASSLLREQRVSVLEVYDIVSSTLVCGLGSFDPSNHRFRHGPGVVSNRPSYSNKYCWGAWSDRLDREFPVCDYGFHNYQSWAAADLTNLRDSVENASRLVCVPKSYKGPRLIAAEPCEHQWCQQSMWHYFWTRSSCSLLGKFVHFRDQTKNQELARRGSSDRSLATLDLSSASDRVSCELVGQTFRSNPKVVLGLQATRTRIVEQKLFPEFPARHVLRMFSTMGNACTFPVESIIFVSIALTATLVQKGLAPSSANIESLCKEVAVFGDDIVVPRDSRELCEELLEAFGFKVNTSKSYGSGNFRESCGLDVFRGECVTPVYLRGAYAGDLESLTRTVDVSNNFYNKFLLKVAQGLASRLPKIISSVPSGSGVFGLESRCKIPASAYIIRVNQDLQRTECLVNIVITRTTKARPNDDSGLLQYFTEEPDPTLHWSAGWVSQRPSSRLEKRWVPADDLALNQV